MKQAISQRAKKNQDKKAKDYMAIQMSYSEPLFKIDPTYPDKFCRTCEHRERHQCGSKVIQYCGVVRSNRTANGKLKIKCKTPACRFYKVK